MEYMASNYNVNLKTSEWKSYSNGSYPTTTFKPEEGRHVHMHATYMFLKIHVLHVSP